MTRIEAQNLSVFRFGLFARLPKDTEGEGKEVLPKRGLFSGSSFVSAARRLLLSWASGEYPADCRFCGELSEKDYFAFLRLLLCGLLFFL